MAFFTEIPEWQWHYDPTLDSLYLTTTSHVRFYIFFQRTCVVLIFSLLFNPVAPFERILVYMARPIAVPPHVTPSKHIRHARVIGLYLKGAMSAVKDF